VDDLTFFYSTFFLHFFLSAAHIRKTNRRTLNNAVCGMMKVKTKKRKKEKKRRTMNQMLLVMKMNWSGNDHEQDRIESTVMCDLKPLMSMSTFLLRSPQVSFCAVFCLPLPSYSSSCYSYSPEQNQALLNRPRNDGRPRRAVLHLCL
jgi:hypothetical protein